jgi:hypothetical protein
MVMRVTRFIRVIEFTVRFTRAIGATRVIMVIMVIMDIMVTMVIRAIRVTRAIRLAVSLRSIRFITLFTCAKIKLRTTRDITPLPVHK